MAAGTISSQARFAVHRAGVTRRVLLRRLQQSRLMRWRYSGAPIEQLLLVPQDLRTADPSFASEIYHGHFGLGGAVATTGTESPFLVAPPNQLWLRELQGFGWLRHLHAADDHISREHARALMRDWVEMHRGIGGLAWQPEIVARRVISWLSHAPMVLEAADHEFYDLVMRSLARQLRYLRATHRDAPDGVPRIVTLAALLFAGLCALDQQYYVETYTVPFNEELERQILPDGGHIGRNPAMLIELLLDLLPLRQCFVARDRPPPPALIGAIDRMMPMLRFFRLGDGELARFNGMGATPRDALATLLAYDDAQGTPVAHASDSGYFRAERGRMVVIADVGKPPPLALSGSAHAGCLSFEMSSGEDPVIVNCGAPAVVEVDWLLASRSTAAHSTAAVCDASSSQILPSGTEESTAEARLDGPSSVECQVSEDDAGIEIRAAHDGYLSRFGLVHARRLRLSASGDRLSGEDRLMARHGLKGAAEARQGAFTIRFHLHPSVRARLSQDGRTVLLVTPHREGWRIASDGPPLTIEDSVFLADIKGPRRGLQVVMTGTIENGQEARIGWVMERSVAGPTESMTLRQRMASLGELPLE